MTTTLTACVLVPELLVQLALRHGAVRSPVAVVDDTALARVRQCCRHAAAAGVTPGMPSFLARQHCAHLTTTTLAASIVDTIRATIMALLYQQGDQLVNVGSTGWSLRVLALGPQYGHAPAIAAQMQQAIDVATSLRPVIVFAPTATTAHMLAEAAVTQARTTPLVVRPGDEAAWLAPLRIEYVPGLGAKTAVRLRQFGITTIGAFAALPTATVVQMVGQRGRTLHAAARGHDTAPQIPGDTGLESTWQYAPTACADATVLVRHVQRLTERIGRHLRSQAWTAGTITVAVRWADGRMRQHTERLRVPAEFDQDLAAGSHAALTALLAERRLAVHALTVRLGAVGPQQATVFAQDSRLVERQRALDQIKRRHGTDAIVWASLLPSPP
jgi:DNA polymerase-4